MYRHSAHGSCLGKNAPPSPEDTSDSESDIVDLLDRKRRQLDEEIASFKAAKDREFRDFEKELRRKRRNSPSLQTPDSPSPHKPVTTTPASALDLLAPVQNGSVNRRASHKTKNGGIDRPAKPPPLSKPTLSLDKLTINGETRPPTHSSGTPTTPSSAPKRSPSGSSANVTPPRPQSENRQPPTPASDRSECFAGVFTPVYLPLLEFRDRKSIVRSPQAMSAADEEQKRLQLDVDSKKAAEEQRSRIESSHSLPQQPVSPTVLASKRTHSDPQITGSHLPSALRTSSGGSGRKKRKHVTFQLSNSQVVGPSSSYDEMSGSARSPESRADDDDILEERIEVVEPPTVEVVVPEDGSTTQTGPTSRLLEARARRRGGKGGRFLSPMPSPLPSPSPSPSPTITDGDYSPQLVSPAESGFSGGLVGTPDGGSSVGFFELDEELASPGLREKPLETELESALEDLDLDEKAGGPEDGDGGGVVAGSFAAGSVPIDIVRPHAGMTGSWVGSFGH